MTKILLWAILLVLCWPLAIAVLALYPFAWLVALPFRVLGTAVDGMLALIRGLFMLPGRLLAGKQVRPTQEIVVHFKTSN